MSHSDRVLRESLVKSTKILAGQNVNVVMEGFSPRTSYDPRTKKVSEIVIPMVPDNCPKPLVDAIMGMQDHEAAHVLYSDNKDMANTNRGSTWTYLLNAIEDTRVNHRMASDYPGTHIELKNSYNYLHDNLDAYKADHIKKMFATNKKEATAGYIGPWLARKMNSDFQSEWYDASPLPEMMKHLDDKLPKELADALANCKTASDTRELVDEVVSFLEEYEQELRKMAESSEKSQGRGDDKQKPDKKDKKEKGKGEKGEDEGENEEGEGEGDGEGDESDSDSDSDADGKPSEKEGKGKGKNKKNDKEPPEVDQDAKPLNVKDLPGSFDDALGAAIGKNIELEFKNQKGTFFWSDRMNELVTIDNYSGRRGNIKSADGLEAFDSGCKQVSSYLRKKLERTMESRKRVYYTGGHKSGKLTSKQLFSVPLGNQFVFSKKNDIRAVNACAGLLMDLSGSMSGAKVNLASRCTYTVADCLERLKIPFEALGFWTDSATKLDAYKVMEAYNQFAKGTSSDVLRKVVNQRSINSTFVFKAFDEPFGLKQKCALMAASRSEIGMASNEDATHLRIALERMSRQPHEKKVLFVFSDGQPAFSGDANNSRSKLKELANEAQSKYGVTVVGVGIMCENVKHFYKNSKNITKLEELPNTVFEILSAQLLGK